MCDYRDASNGAFSSIAFNAPYMAGKELYYIAQAQLSLKLAGDGNFTHKCSQWLEKNIGCTKALLMHSCTAALEMCALLLNIQPGDEIIMPSYTFVTTANAFVLRGGVPVFVDIREDTLNIDETLIESAITSKTKAIVVVHYAGVACEMENILHIADKYSLPVIEDAAQGITASYKGKALGSIGVLGALSFHETKNIICGEGGALLINDPSFEERAEIIREKGTNRKKFYRGEVDKYTWVDIGSSFLPGELNAAFLWGQMEEADVIQEKRTILWHAYHDALLECEQAGLLRRPMIPTGCQHNAHLYYILLSARYDRPSILRELKNRGIHALFHYVPLHSSPAGKKLGRVASTMQMTDSLSARLIRLPLWNGLCVEQVEYIVDNLYQILASRQYRL